MSLSPLSPLDLQPGQWRPVLEHLFARYEELGHLHSRTLERAVGPELAERTTKMCTHARGHLDVFTEDKANRWLGFVQGMLTVAGLIQVDAERDYTRPLFHAIHGPSASHDVGSTGEGA